MMKTLIWIWAIFSLLVRSFAIDLGIQASADSNANDGGQTRRWTSIVTFRDEDINALNDFGQLTGLASEAYDEMVADQKSTQLDVHKQPYTMTAISVGNKVYFSSTIKGGAFVYQSQRSIIISDDIVNTINVALTRCVTQQNPRHRTGAACGEILATQMYFVENAGQAINDKGGKAVTWGKFFDDGDYDSTELGVLNPCANNDGVGFGCGTFISNPLINVKGLYGTNAQPSPLTVQVTATKIGCLA